MKIKHYFFIVLFSYLFFLVASVPVNFLTTFINDNTPVKIQGASGTVWNGQARFISVNKIADLNNTKWSFKIWKLYTGSAAFQISTHYADQKITSEVGMTFLKKFFVNNLTGKISADDIAKLTNIPIAQLSGMITLDIEHAHWKRDELPKASGNVIWKDATISVAETVSLGIINITLNENEQNLLNADIKNQGGDILLSGNAELIPEKNYSVNVKLTPTATTSSGTEKSLSLFSKKQNNGNYLLKKTGQLNQLGLL